MKSLFALSLFACLFISQAFSQVSLFLEDLGSNSYRFTVTNVGPEFNISNGNDRIEIGKASGQPNLLSISLNPKGWDDFSSFPNYATLQAPAFPLTPAFPNGDSISFDFTTATPSTIFDYGILFELGDGGSSIVQSGSIAPVAVPEASITSLILALLSFGIYRFYRRQK